MTAVTTHDLNVVHVLVCIDHELIEVHVVGEAMLSDSLSHLQEHFVLLGCAKLLIRTNVEVVARDTLGRVVLLFAFLSAILGVRIPTTASHLLIAFLPSAESKSMTFKACL